MADTKISTPFLKRLGKWLLITLFVLITIAVWLVTFAAMGIYGPTALQSGHGHIVFLPLVGFFLLVVEPSIVWVLDRVRERPVSEHYRAYMLVIKNIASILLVFGLAYFKLVNGGHESMATLLLVAVGLMYGAEPVGVWLFERVRKQPLSVRYHTHAAHVQITFLVIGFIGMVSIGRF